VMTLFLGVLLSVAAISWLLYYNRAVPSPNAAEAVVLIPPGSSFEQTAAILADAGLIRQDIRFSILARLHGLASKVRAGEFRLATGMPPMETLETLVQAEPLQHPVTIVEGWRAGEIAHRFAQYGFCDADTFLELVHDKEFISSLGLEGLTGLEGYLYPDTYYLTRVPALDAEKIIKMMVERFLQVWKTLDSGEAELHTTVILASIVEKETGAAEERPRIASVFANRLRKGMRLQSDPTVIYTIDDFSGTLTRTDLRRKTAYNTYVVRGLPAGPICSPGRAALAAVLNPADEQYLYFVSKNDGSHYFSRTLRQHNRAVQKYQR
ncbi:MAG: endolytic transglycosylase MltG, partial [Desulfopila sp.]